MFTSPSDAGTRPDPFPVHRHKLCYFGPEGELISTPAEAALQERQKAERLAAHLYSLRADPD
ncbi:MAG: hypothetical protein Q6L60_07015 [Thermostichus sp. HHBFW_bins_43]